VHPPDRIFVISDIHLGVDNALTIFHADTALARFLAMCTGTAGRVELVLLGDVFDYLQLAPSLAFDPATAVRKTDEILVAHPQVFDALAAFIREPGKTLVWFIGNHDLELAFPEVRARIEARLGRTPTWHLGHEARVHELTGNAKIHLVHGNDADPFNRVDYIRLAEAVAHGGAADDIYPIGSRMVNQVLNPLKAAGHIYIDLLKPEEEVAVKLALALWPDDVIRLFARAFPIIVTGKARNTLDSLKAMLSGPRKTFRGGAPQPPPAPPRTDEEHALGRLFFQPGAPEGALASGELLDWFERPTPWRPGAPAQAFRGGHGVPLKLLKDAILRNTVNDAFDPQGADDLCDKSEYVSRQGAILVVAGHTHLARAREREGSYYINTGTWADLMRIPPNLARTDFKLVAQNLLEHLRDPSTGPSWLRPFRRLTYADIALPGGTDWSARLCRWPESEVDVLAVCP